MRLVHVRRIAQGFFLLLLLWFCVVATLGERWWEWRGWPVNWLLQLDPLSALATLLATTRLYTGLAWAVLTIGLTLFLGRFFCGWVCPFGTLHQVIGWLGRRTRSRSHRILLNRYHPAQQFKYYLLFALLGCAGAGLVGTLFAKSKLHPVAALFSLVAFAVVVLLLAARLGAGKRRHWTFWLAVGGILLAALGVFMRPESLVSVLHTGLLDPIPLVYRSFNLVIIALFGPHAAGRFYVGAWSIALVFAIALAANIWVPRFYCRFLCPLGALFGVLVRWTPWRLGKRSADCCGCNRCEDDCEGACDPLGKIRWSECLLCMNCLETCPQDHMRFSSHRSAGGEINSPEVSRRGFILASTGLGAGSLTLLRGAFDNNWNPEVVRPPGALAEADFLQRCIKCGQCMRVCPTNVVQPAWLEAGLEGLWTPVLNFRVGTSGCQLNCIACGQICPTSALRPLSLDEKLGKASFEAAGPVRMGTAFVDRTRCLPWTADVPCIVCQENCPVSPKAIFLSEEYQVIRDGSRRVKSSEAALLELEGPGFSRPLASGDYFLRVNTAAGFERKSIEDCSGTRVRVSTPFSDALPAGSVVAVEVRLQRPVIDLERCIGCGVCEHECPVSGLRAIRVTAENETRNPRHSLRPGAGTIKQI